MVPRGVLTESGEWWDVRPLDEARYNEQPMKADDPLCVRCEHPQSEHGEGGCFHAEPDPSPTNLTHVKLCQCLGFLQATTNSLDV